jgi:hypothetical protein
MLCQNCRQLNDSDQSYCRFCGAALMQPQQYQPPQPQPKPYGWASPSSPLHDFGDPASNEPRQVQPITAQPPVHHAPNTNPLAPQRGYHCPRCNSTALPIRKKQMSDGGWLTLVIMLLFCFPLFWIGFLMTEEYSVCPTCLARIS